MKKQAVGIVILVGLILFCAFQSSFLGGLQVLGEIVNIFGTLFVWLLKYWWVPVCVTTLCYLFGLAGDFYSYANHSDYLCDWVPYTQLTFIIGCLSFLWRGTAFFMALAKKKWRIAIFLLLFHLLCWVLFYFVNLRYYPYSEL